jgi:putative heme-binding domain-containing protein
MLWCLLVGLGTLVPAAQVPAGQRPPESKPAIASGQKIFSSMCASCHGLDGRGSERAPNIARSAALQQLSDDKVAKIIRQGVPGTGMPAFPSLGTSGLSAVVGYLRLLQGKERFSALPGDAARGRTLFFGSAGCSSCHMFAGEGGFIAKDLSAYSNSHTIADIKDAIAHPNRNSESSSMHVLVTTQDAAKFDGIIRNQDNFSIQLQALDGTFHFLMKNDIVRIEHLPPVMPAKDAAVLPTPELNDVIRFLVSTRQNRNLAVSEDGD